jgi:hypothetical protein
MISNLISILKTLNTDKEISHAINQSINDGMFSFNDAINFLAFTNQDDIGWGLQIISHFDSENITPIVEPYFTNTNLEIQYCAVMAIRQNPHPDAIPLLVKLLSQPDALLCRLVGDALVAIGTEATSDLHVIAQQPINNGVIEAVRTLALIRDANSITTLFNLLDSPSTQVQTWAEKGLEDLGIGMTFFDPH